MKWTKRLILFSLFAINLVDQPAPEVTIEQGTLSGKISTDGTFFEYLGIPYGTSDKSRRFQAPGPPPSWTGVYKAVDEMHSCAQNGLIGVVGSEDCLRINVYVPAKANRPLPVMVYIHGGAFLIGSGGKILYAPEFIVAKDVVLVTFNYRLGILGFLCLGIKEAPGNAGLKDQVAALRWVQKNIAAFGGNADDVTLFGQSAGGTSLSILLASNATNGLFHKAIIQSGSSVSNWAINRQPVWTAGLIAKSLGYDTEDPHEIYKIFSQMNYWDLLKAKATKPLGKFFDTQLMHLPCVENRVPGIEPVIDDLPYNLLIKNSKNIPVIFGSTSGEGLFLIAGDSEQTLKERNGKYLFASDLIFSSEEEADAVAKNVHGFYFGNEVQSMKNAMTTCDVYTHLYFEMPSIIESEILAKKNKAPVFNYYFNYSGGRNFLKQRTGYTNASSACHGDDIFYIFDSRLIIFPINEDDRRVIDAMTTMWTNFAKYGHPTPSSELPVKWTPSDKEKINFLYIEDEFKMGPIPNIEAYKLWKDVYSKYRNPKNG